MNILVAGKSPVNDIFVEQLTKEGFEPVLIEDISKIISFTGEKGNFRIVTRDDNYDAGYVIITENTASGNSVEEEQNSGFPFISLYQLENIPFARDDKNPVVLLLDFPQESPAFITRLALHQSIRLAKKQKKIFYMAKFMRTAGSDYEKLFREARNLGVTFIKYNDIVINYDTESGVFNINATDVYDNIELKTTTLISARKPVPGALIKRLSKLFRLRLDENSFFNGDNYFLFPFLTSRKGVYVFNSNEGIKGEKDTSERVLFTVSAIKKELSEKGNLKHAKINNLKCAFCYTCYRACPHASMVPDTEKSVMKNLEEACFGCGICASVCPANAIEITGKAAENMASGYRSGEENIEAHGHLSAEGNQSSEAKLESQGYLSAEVRKGSVKVFCCENSGEIALKRYIKAYGAGFENIKIVPFFCGGDIDTANLISALKEFDRVIVAVCMDNACRHFEGNRRASLQVQKAKEMLQAAGLDAGRLNCIRISAAMPSMMKEYV